MQNGYKSQWNKLLKPALGFWAKKLAFELNNWLLSYQNHLPNNCLVVWPHEKAKSQELMKSHLKASYQTPP